MGALENLVGTACCHDPVALTSADEELNEKAGTLGNVKPSVIPILCVPVVSIGCVES